MAILATNSANRNGAFAELSNIFANVVGAIQRRRVYRTTVIELARLSERELSDLGITRGDIERIAREASQAA